jgi:glycerol kinase
MVNTKEKIVRSEDGLLTTVAYKLNNETNYALEGSIYSCGNIIQWLRDKMEFFESAKESELLINSNGESGNVHFLPAFNGLGAPYWNSDVRGGFQGITQNSDKKDFVTAAFKSICYQTKDIIESLNNKNIFINDLLVDGGMTSNNTFCQLLSDSLGIDISKPSNIESTALGACVVSQISEGVPLEEIKNKLDKKFISNEANSSFYKHDYEAWKNYLESSIANLKDK